MEFKESFTVAIPNYTSLTPMLSQLNHSFEEGKINERINGLSLYAR